MSNRRLRLKTDSPRDCRFYQIHRVFDKTTRIFFENSRLALIGRPVRPDRQERFFFENSNSALIGRPCAT